MRKLLFSLFSLLIVISAQASWKELDKYGETCLFDLKTTDDLEGEHAVLIEAILETYKDFSPETLGIATSKEVFGEDVFEDFQKDFSKGAIKLITVSQQGKVVGFIGFQATDIPNEIYINLMAIHPSCWNRGIGRQLIFSILKELPHTDHFVLVTRHINERAKKFYTSLGFRKSSYMHEGCSPQKYIGYELTLTTGAKMSD